MESDGNRVYRVLQGIGYYSVLESTGLHWGILGRGVHKPNRILLFLIKILSRVRRRMFSL